MGVKVLIVTNDDMNDWFVKTLQEREEHGFVELIFRLLRQSSWAIVGV